MFKRTPTFSTWPCDMTSRAERTPVDSPARCIALAMVRDVEVHQTIRL